MLPSDARYCFVADLHLGPDTDPDGAREAAFVRFLQELPSDLKGLFLLGDIFDFWVDYKYVVPRGGVRVLAALAEVVQRTDVWFFRGNHDWWVTDYFEQELGVHIVREPWRVFDLDGKRVLLGHGDTLGVHDCKSKLIFHVFRNKVCIALLRALPTRWVFAFARRWSKHSRQGHPVPPPFPGRESGLWKFADAYGRNNPPADYYIFGHLHTRAEIPVDSGGILVVLGAGASEENCFTL